MKQFNRWHIQKEFIDNNKKAPRFHEREIWWASIGLNIGDEEDGKNDQFERPVLVINLHTSEVCNRFNSEIAWIIPMSTKLKDNPYYFLTYDKDNNGFSLMLSQMRVISTKRLTRFVRKLLNQEYSATPFHTANKFIIIIRLTKNQSKNNSNSKFEQIFIRYF